MESLLEAWHLMFLCNGDSANLTRDLCSFLQTVGFAKNMFVGCTQSFTRNELRDFCTSNQHPMLASHGVGAAADHFMIPKWLQTSQDLLGIFGNADPLDRRQWTKARMCSL